MASFQDLGVDHQVGHQGLLASAFSLVQGNSSGQEAFQVFASCLEGPFEVALAFGIRLDLFAWVHGAFSF